MSNLIKSNFNKFSYKKLLKKVCAPNLLKFVVLLLSIDIVISALLIQVPAPSGNMTVAQKSFSRSRSLFKRITEEPRVEAHHEYQVFGFAPYWTLERLDNVDFSMLTTFAYFGIPITARGDLNTEDIGYEKFLSPKAQNLFAKARRHGTHVVLTLTQMNNADIKAFLADRSAWEKTAEQTTQLMKTYDLDGINIDIEYTGNPGEEYRAAFTDFVALMTARMHHVNPNSKVTVSVYAASAVSPKMYAIADIANASDGIFMMAYDFATTSSDVAMPTAPLYGHKEGKYWYDVSTAVEDFLKQMPPEKLILGVPYYGYNYVVSKPEVKAKTYPRYSWRGQPMAQTYAIVQDTDTEMSGWDDAGQVGWKAYAGKNNTWRMVFSEDTQSLSKKYDFAKDKRLGGVGIWALGFDHNRTDLWDLLRTKFSGNLADSGKVQIP